MDASFSTSSLGKKKFKFQNLLFRFCASSIFILHSLHDFRYAFSFLFKHSKFQIQYFHDG